VELSSRIVDADWWNKKGDELADCLGTVFRKVRDENEWRTEKDEFHWGLYEGTGLGGINISSRRNYTYESATLPDNVCKMAVDTLVSKVATVRPLPQVATSRGNFKDKRRGRKLRQFIQGEFHRQRLHEKVSPRIIKDALVGRGGVVQIYADRDTRKPAVERVHIWTLFADDWDAEFGEPLSFYRLRRMDRSRAIRMLAGSSAKKREALRNASVFSSSVSRLRDEARASVVERVELVEAWHRCPNHEDLPKDHQCVGRYALICEGCTLIEREWPHGYFPFAFLFFDQPNVGFWGNGIVQAAEGYQASINEANAKANEAYALTSKMLVIRDGSGITDTQIVDGLRIVKCRPGPYEPTVHDIDLVNEHIRMRPMELKQACLNDLGISTMSAQARKPTGADSGAALQTLDDIESQRHIVFGRAFESWSMDVARMLIDVVKDIAEEYGDYETSVPMKGTYLPLKWSEVKVDGFQLEMQPIGQLFQSITGRIDRAQKMFEANLIDGFTLMRVYEDFDLQSEMDLETVDRLVVDEMLQRMEDAEGEPLEMGEPDPFYVAPHAKLPLEWAYRRTKQHELQAELDGASLRVLDLLGRFRSDLEHFMRKAGIPIPGEPPPPMAPPVDPMGVAPPTIPQPAAALPTAPPPVSAPIAA
jgi:hypothetical protein